jgi:hypothetical protein
MLSLQGCQPPLAFLCTQNFNALESIFVEVPIGNERVIYTKDILPQIYASFTIPSGSLVKGFFVQRSIPYQYNDNKWLEQSISTLLYNTVKGYEVAGLGTYKSPIARF